MGSLHDAARSGNISLMSQLLNDINKQDTEFCTPLHRAAEEGQLEAVKYLLEKGADVKAQDNFERTALFKAAAKGYGEIVDLLLQKDEMQTHSKCKNCGTTALSKAAENGYIKVVTKLLDHHAEQDANLLRLKPVDLASRNAHEEVRLLLNERKMRDMAELKEDLIQHLKCHVEDRHLESFFPGTTLEAALEPAAERAAQAMKDLVRLGIEEELGQDLVLLTLYDVALLIDDSNSMKFEEQGKRIPALRLSLLTIAALHSFLSYEAPGTVSKHGIRLVRYLNGNLAHSKVCTADDVEEIMKKMKYGGTTKIGTELKAKILDPLFYKKPQARPLLIMVITDGKVEGEDSNTLENTILDCVKTLEERGKLSGAHSSDSDVEPRTAYGVAFQFTRIGNNKGAEKFLRQLDVHPKLHDFVDCSTGALDVEEVIKESDDSRRKRMTKLMVGAIKDTWNEYEPDFPEDQADQEDI